MIDHIPMEPTSVLGSDLALYLGFTIHHMWRRQWHPTLVLLPGESHGQRSLVGYSPWGHRVMHD